MPLPGVRVMTRASYSGLLVAGRPDVGGVEWLAAMARGFDALDFLERSRELAAETVVRSALDAIPSPREDSPGSGARPPVR
jgi:hypothetical protein